MALTSIVAVKWCSLTPTVTSHFGLKDQENNFFTLHTNQQQTFYSYDLVTIRGRVFYGTSYFLCIIFGQVYGNIPFIWQNA